MPNIVIPVSGREARYAKALTIELREDEPPAGLDRTEFICPVCMLSSRRPTRFGLCVDDAADLGLPTA